MNTTRQTVVDNPTDARPPIFTDLDSASDALLARWEDAEEQPSADENEEATPAAQEETEVLEEEQEILEEVELDDDENETDPDDEETESEEEEETEEIELSDDTLIDILVDGETKQASVKELKRLYGQEASLTRKSQQVAEQRKQAEESIGKTDAVLQRMLAQAEERWKPYSEVDMLVASKAMDTEDFAQLRKEAQAAEEELKFIREEADQFYKDIRAQQQQQLQAAAKEALSVLQEDLPDWSTALYDDIRAYAVSQGLPQEQVDNYVDPAVIKILNKARLYDQGKKVSTVKRKKAAAKVISSKKSPPTNSQLKEKRLRDAKAKLRERGNDLDDIADVIMQRWEV